MSNDYTEVGKVGNVQICKCDLPYFDILKVDVEPRNGECVLEFRDCILAMSSDMHKVSNAGREALLKEIEMKLNGIIIAFVGDVIKKGEQK